MASLLKVFEADDRAGTQKKLSSNNHRKWRQRKVLLRRENFQSKTGASEDRKQNYRAVERISLHTVCSEDFAWFFCATLLSKYNIWLCHSWCIKDYQADVMNVQFFQSRACIRNPAHFLLNCFNSATLDDLGALNLSPDFD